MMAEEQLGQELGSEIPSMFDWGLQPLHKNLFPLIR